MRTRNIVIIVVVSCTVVLGAAAISGWLIYSILSGRILGFEPPPTPAKLKEARVVVGQGFLSRSVFVDTGSFKAVKGVGSINDIKFGEFDSHPGAELVVAGTDGALVLDRDGVLQSRTVFHYPITQEKVGPFSSPQVRSMMGDRQVVDLEGDGVCEYVARGSIDGAAVFDHQGALLWAYGQYTKENTGIDNLTIGDLDGDGVAEFVVSWDGIEVFDKSGNRRSQVPEKYGDSPIEVVDTDGDGKNEIVSVSGTLKIRNAAGQIIKELPTSPYIGEFSLCQMPGQKQPVMLTVYDSKLWLIDFKGNKVVEFNAPFSEFDDTVDKYPDGTEHRGTSVYKARGLWIKLGADQPEYLAVVKSFAGIHRSVLDVYTPTGKLVYQEVLPEGSESIAVLPPADASGAPELLVGGGSTVWRYRLK